RAVRAGWPRQRPHADAARRVGDPAGRGRRGLRDAALPANIRSQQARHARRRAGDAMMERQLVCAILVLAPVAMAVSALAAGWSAREPSWWRAAVQLAVLGGIALMIYGVNIHIVPVFARRAWRSSRLLVAQVVAGGAGAWLAFAGIGFG